MSKIGQAFVAAGQKFALLSPVMKAVSTISAILGLATALVSAYSAISGHFAQREAFAGLIKVADTQLHDGEYYAAWNANAKALTLAPRSEPALDQQARIAMRWLEDVRLSAKPGAKNFGDIADPLEDALAQRAPLLKGAALADVAAHIGWARFLRSRDGVTGLRILEEFDAALAVDPGNMYAHVMRGFFLVWKGEPVDSARADFDAALASRTDPAFCDFMVLSALTNFHSDTHQLVAADYANKIRKTGRSVDRDLRERVLWAYENGLGDLDYLGKLARIVPAAEQIANLDWLMQGQNADRQRNDRVLRAYFLEQAGQAPQALALYREVVDTSADTNNRAVALARSGIRRLSAGEKPGR
jgi:hypothetical protein